MPQTAASFELEYRAPQFWWVSADINYLSDSYLDVSNILRTQNFVTNPSTGLVMMEQLLENCFSCIKTTKFDAFNLVNISGGKSWKIDGTTLGFLLQSTMF